MNARELRIGDLVQDKRGELIEIESITESGINLSLPDCLFEIDYADLEPIPLTEELLLKCGFEIMSDDLIKFTLPHTAYRISFTRGTVYTDIGKGSEHWFLHVDNFDCATIGCGRLEFLHQLQNLYFALIGEELKVKL